MLRIFKQLQRSKINEDICLKQLDTPAIKLPIDLQDLIAEYLDACSLANAEGCGFFHKGLDTATYWRSLIFTEISQHPKLYQNESYKDYYRRAYELRRRINQINLDNQQELLDIFKEIVREGYDQYALLLIDKIDINQILKESNNPHEPNNTFLLRAAYQGNAFLVKLFLEYGAEVNARAEGYMAIVSDRPHRGNWLREHGPTALILAAGKGSLECLQLLIEKQAAINFRTLENHETALHTAARNGFVDCVLYLLQHGADPNLRTKAGSTALNLAAQFDHPDCISLLNMCTEELIMQTPSFCRIL
jgi:ankyrin repeat protein